MRIVLDTTILVRATESSRGVARELLLSIVEDKHTLLLSAEMLYELARVLASLARPRFAGIPCHYGTTA